MHTQYTKLGYTSSRELNRFLILTCKGIQRYLAYFKSQIKEYNTYHKILRIKAFWPKILRKRKKRSSSFKKYRWIYIHTNTSQSTFVEFALRRASSAQWLSLPAIRAVLLSGLSCRLPNNAAYFEISRYIQWRFIVRLSKALSVWTVRLTFTGLVNF